MRPKDAGFTLTHIAFRSSIPGGVSGPRAYLSARGPNSICRTPIAVRSKAPEGQPSRFAKPISLHRRGNRARLRVLGRDRGSATATTSTGLTQLQRLGALTDPGPTESPPPCSSGVRSDLKRSAYNVAHTDAETAHMTGTLEARAGEVLAVSLANNKRQGPKGAGVKWSGRKYRVEPRKGITLSGLTSLIPQRKLGRALAKLMRATAPGKGEWRQPGLGNYWNGSGGPDQGEAKIFGRPEILSPQRNSARSFLI